MELSSQGLDELILKLSRILSFDTDTKYSEANALLDKLNALDYQVNFVYNHGCLEALLHQCFSGLPPSNTFLVAKCCHLILNLVRKQSISFQDSTVELFLNWACLGLKSAADVAFLDILQAINEVIKASPKYFEKKDAGLLKATLLDELETRSSLSNPSDVKVWRLNCLQSLALVLPVGNIPEFVGIFIDVLNTHPATDLISHAQVWRNVLEALDGLCVRNSDWILGSLSEILGAILASIHLGLHGVKPKQPKQVFPSSSVFQEPQPPKNKGPKINVRGPKKQKAKVKQVGWTQNEEHQSCGPDKAIGSPEFYNPCWPTSDSDFSDGEGGKSARLAKEQARTRHAAINLLIQLVKVCGCKQLYGYYNVFLGPGGLLYSVRQETSLRPRIASLAAITALLSRAKLFLAQAQYSEGGSFTPFSGALSELVSTLHSTLCAVLSSSPSSSLAVPLLHCTSILISVTPYHRLRPTLLTNLFKAFQPLLTNRDLAVCVGAVKCLTEIASAEPPTDEHENIVQTGCQGNQTSNWLVSLALQNIETGGNNETLQVGWWQLMTGLCRCHFSKVLPCLNRLEDVLLRDLSSSFKLIQLYAAHTLEYICGHIVTNEDLRSHYCDLWMKLLTGPLVPILQSPTFAASVGCDCVANMGAIAYTNLPEKIQIMVITLIYGCSSHEEGGVRASAVRALGMFLLFPHFAEEQPVCDINEILVKALSDPIGIVRVKAAWSFGNLVDLLLAHKDKEFVQAMSIIKLLDASLSIMNDNEKVKSNMVRAIGTLLLLVTEAHLEEVQYREGVEKAAIFLVKCATTGNCMKMRWNACYSLSNMLRNEDLHRFSSKWQVSVINGLCGLLVRCSNFKVRLNASAALCSIAKREYYSGLYHNVWQALINGLDNAANMPDFREFKHQDGLIQQLCVTLCHVTTQLELEDLHELEDILSYRVETLHQHLSQFQISAPPERSNSILSAANHIQSLLGYSVTSSQRESLKTLQEIFVLNT